MILPIGILLAFASDPLSDARSMPPLFKVGALLATIEEHQLEGRQAFEVAKEAYETALKLDLTLEAKSYPLALEMLGPPQDVRVQAWEAYQKHRDPRVDPAVPFPERPRTSPARCEHSVVDSAEEYLESAMKAGSDSFWIATLNLRSPSEIEDAWRHYKNLNQALAPCPPDRTSTAVRANFAELKWWVLHPTNDQDLGLRQVEDILNLYSLVEHDEQKLDELESAGNRLLQLFVRGLRNGLPKRDPAPPQPPPPPPPPPKR